MLVNTVFDEESKDIDIIDVPSSLLKNLSELQDDFYKWLFNKENNHCYWIYKDGKKAYCSYRSDAFVFWLNNIVLKGGADKARVISKWNNELLPDNPILYF